MADEWSEFTEVPDIWSEFSDAGTSTRQTLDKYGLGILDDLTGGGAQRNARDPYFNPALVQQQESARDIAMRNAQRRADFLAENPMDWAELDTPTQAIVGLGQGALDLTRGAAGLADAFGNPIISPLARRIGKAAGAEAGELEELTTGPGSGVGATLQVLGRGATSVLPSFIAGYLGGLPASIVAAGAQSFGATFEDAQDGYIQAGLDPETAKTKAYAPALISGLITAGLTKAFGAGALDDFRGVVNAKTVKGLLDKPIRAYLQQMGQANIRKEAIEEALDEFAQGVVAQKSYDPSRSVEDVIMGALQAGALGAILGGVGEGVATGVRKIRGIDDEIDLLNPIPGSTPPVLPGFQPQPGPAAPAAEQPIEPPIEPAPAAPVVEPEIPVEEEGSVPAEEVFKELRLPPYNVPPSPEPEVATSGLRRGKREKGASGIGVRILEALGADTDIAREFVAEWMKANPEVSSLEEMRAKLIADYDAAGLKPEGAESYARENPDDYEKMGFSRAQAEEFADNARVSNKALREDRRQSNKQVLSGLRRGVRSEVKPEVRAEMEVAQPTDAQKEAGNYKKAHIQLDGMDIAIENVQGSVRSGKDNDGEIWQVVMPADYGYVKGTKGKDGDQVDLYIGPAKNDPNAPVFVVDQVNAETGKFDEHKVLYGFPNQEMAVAVYDAAFSDGKGPQRRGGVTALSKEQFKEWLDSGKTKKPLALEGGEKVERKTQERVQEPEVQGVQVAPAVGADIAPAPAPSPEPKMRTIKEEAEYKQLYDRRNQQAIDEVDLKKLKAKKKRSPADDAEIRELQKKKKLTKKELARLDELDKKPAHLKKFKSRRVWNDFIETMEGLGIVIRAKSIAKEGTKADYTSDYDDAVEMSALKKFFSTKGGVTPDDARKSMEGHFGITSDSKTDDLWEKMIGAAMARKEARKLESKEKKTLDEMGAKTEEFQKFALENDRKGKEKTKALPVPASILEHGDTFTIDGEPFQVTGIQMDGETGQVGWIEVDDGKRFDMQSLNGSWVFYPDDGYVGNPDFADDGEGVVPYRMQTKKPSPVIPFPTTMDAEGQQVLETGEGGALSEIPGQIEAAQMSQMQAEQSTPLAADDITIQEDMFGAPDPAAQDIPLFNQRTDEEQFELESLESKENLTSDELRRQRMLAAKEPPVGRAEGAKEAADLFEKSDLPSWTKAVARKWFETPLMRDLDWSKLIIELRNLGPDISGIRVGRFIRMSDSAGSATLPHEISHIIYEALPEQYRQHLEKHRLKSLGNGFSKEVVDMVRGTVTSEEFLAMIPKLQEMGLTPEQINLLYKHTSPSEFYAYYIGDKFASQAFKDRGARSSVWEKLRKIFMAAFDAVMRALGVNPTLERVYRETIAGVWAPDIDAIVQAEAQFSYVTTARQARNAAELQKSQQERLVEGAHQLAQSFDLVQFLNDKGAAIASFAAQKALRYFDYIGILATGTQLNNGQAESYQQIKARTTDQYQRNWMARIVSVQVADFEQTMKEVVAEGQKAFRDATSKVFLNKLAKRAAAAAKMTNAKLVDEAAAAMLEAAHKKAIQVLREEAKSDLEIAEAEGMVRAIEEAKNSSSAMAILINDMINVLSSTQDGINALSNPNITQKEIKRIYADIKRSAGQTLFSENLMNWAANILARNAELRDALWAAQLARNSTLRAQMGAYEKKFLADLENNPLGTMRRELRAKGKRTTEYERARFAYLTLNKEVMSELAELQSKIEAGEVAQNILADQRFKAFRKEVFDDAGVEGTQRPLIAFADKLFLLPSGREINVDPEFIRGSKVEFNSTRAQYLAAAADLQNWLANNPDDPNWGVHRRTLAELQDYFTSMSLLQPGDQMKMFNVAMTIVRDAVNVAGGRMQGTVLKAVNHWNKIKDQASRWMQRWSAINHEARIKAMKSHGLKWRSFSSFDEVKANRLWWNNVGNFLNYTHQRQQGGWKVGDKLPSGWTVTPEDFEAMRVQSRMTTAGFEVIKDEQLTEDDLGKVTLYRPAIKGTENMTRRVPNKDFESFAAEYSAVRKEFQTAFKNRDQAAMARFEQQMIDLLNRKWSDIGLAFVWDRNEQFANATIFDGEGNAFDVISKRMLNNPNYITSFDQFLDEVVALSNSTRDEVKSIVMAEWGHHINNWNTQFRDESEGKMILPVRGQLAKNASTKSRNNAVAPYVFYEYGFKDARSIATFAGGLHSRPLDRVVAGLIAMEKDLDRQIGELKESKNEKALKNRTAIARRNGDTYDNLKSLEKRKKVLKRVLKSLVSYDEDQDVDISFARTLSAVTGLLISGIKTTTKNFTTGPLYLGKVANQLYASTALETYPMTLYYAYLEGAKGWASVGKQGLKWLGKKIVYAPVDVPVAIMQIAKGNWRGAYNSYFRDLIDVLGNQAIDEVRNFKEMRDKGLIFVPEFQKEFDNHVLGSFLYQGKLAANELGPFEKVLQAPVAAVEGSILAFTRTYAPTIGDVAVNSATANFFQSSYGPIKRHEKRLKELYLDYSRNQYRQFDFNNLQSEVNIFSAKEVFPNAIDAERAFTNAVKFFEEAGLNYHELATRFIGELHSNPQAQFLNEEETQKIVNLAIDLVNRSSPAGSPRGLQQNNFLVNLVKPFWSWKIRTFQIFNRMMSVPAQSRRSRHVQWAMLMTTLVLPMLLMNAAIQTATEETDRALALFLFNQEKSSRQPWEREGVKSQAIGWLIQSTIGIPFLDIAVNSTFNDLPVRAGLYPDLVMLEKMKDVTHYMGGAIQTGDPWFKLPELIGGFVPDAKIILNRLESESGKRLSSNALAIMRRHGDTELLRMVGEPIAGVNYNELSPYGPAMENAAMNGDLTKFSSLFNEAVGVAQKIGRPEPEQTARQLFQHRNPYDRAFKSKLTEEQKRAFLARLSESERADILEMERRFQAAAQIAGVNFNTFKGENKPVTVSAPSNRGGIRRVNRGVRRVPPRRGLRRN